MTKKSSQKKAKPTKKPATRPTPSRPEDQPSMDPRDWHGLSEGEALHGKK